MARLALLPLGNGAPVHAGAEVRRMPRGRARAQTRYYAFLSYSHQDEEIADWLHRELEKFRVPSALAGRLTANGVIPKRLTPIFRDEHDLSAADDLGDEIEAAISASQFMIVLCSPAAARSRWTSAEVDLFKRTGREGCLLAAVASGEPFASDMPGREQEECFPPALRVRYDRRGRPTTKRAEPLAADLRGDAEERRTGFLKLVAGMLGVGLDDLVQRDTTRRHRQMAWLVAASLAGMAVTSGLAITAIHARDAARDQRREAEGLVAFMLGDLKDKLEPIGKLDALDGVGSRVLAYYSKQDTSELSDAALLQRSRALSLTAQVANARGQHESALKLFREAKAGTGEAVRRAPNDPQRLFDHAQNVFWIGDISRLHGQLGAAESSYREYKQLADRMVALQPDNLKWRMETQYAEANLGILYVQQRRFALAERAFEQALRTIESLASIDPRNMEYQKSRADALAWLADTTRSEGKFAEAIALRRRQIALLEQLAARNEDVDFDERAVPAHNALAMLLDNVGQRPAAEAEFRLAIAQAQKLIGVDAQNAIAQGLAAAVRLRLAHLLMASNRQADAAAETRAACSLAEALVRRDPTVVNWRIAQSECFAATARLEAAAGDEAGAARLLTRAIANARTVQSGDAINDRYVLASYERLLGDVQQKAGNRPAAMAAWTAGLAALPANAVERPSETNERFQLLRRVGKTDQARVLAERLAALNYKSLD